PFAIKFLHPYQFRYEDLRFCERDALCFDRAASLNRDHSPRAVLGNNRKGGFVSRGFRESKPDEVRIAEIQQHKSLYIKGGYIRRRFLRGCRSKCGNTSHRNGSAAQYTEEITSIHAVHVDSFFRFCWFGKETLFLSSLLKNPFTREDVKELC